MKLTTSLTLSDDVLAAVDELAGPAGSRSAVIERILRDHLDRRAHPYAAARERDTLDDAADRMNAEAADVLEYQAPWPGE